MDAAEKVRRAASGQRPISRVAHDEGAAHDPERGGVEILEAAYMAASGGGALPAMARQIYYQARPKIMALTDDKELQYGYFSQTLLPDYIEEHGVAWNVVYDARGHFEEPHTNRRIGCGTIEVGNYLHAMKDDRRSSPPPSPAPASTLSVHPEASLGSCSAKRRDSIRCSKRSISPIATTS